ncbi:branched-chain amino acid ABC transporter substrate-binding protein [Streptomyces sp. NPDC051211]|uniref:branched-chain amino acid ABC transporter substrate-binding protein n=1 Tax=Streptomyces sp. NPDC051211 TaxID=3154643 RepID=UPI00344E9FB8
MDATGEVTPGEAPVGGGPAGEVSLGGGVAEEAHPGWAAPRVNPGEAAAGAGPAGEVNPGRGAAEEAAPDGGANGEVTPVEAARPGEVNAGGASREVTLGKGASGEVTPGEAAVGGGRSREVSLGGGAAEEAHPGWATPGVNPGEAAAGGAASGKDNLGGGASGAVNPGATSGAVNAGTGASGDGIDWLPDAVVATIAERAAALLALPGIDETVADPAADGASGGRSGPSRRRFLALAAGGAVLAAGGGLAAWLTLREDEKPKAAAAPATRPWLIGVHADLSGPQQAAGRAQERGVRLAVAAFNARTDKPFTLDVATVDDGGRADRSAEAAAELIGRDDLFAVIGPTGNESVIPCLELYGEAAVPLLSVSALATTYSTTDRRSFFQSNPLSSAQALGVNLQLGGRQKVRRLGLLCDRDGDADGWQAIQLVGRTLDLVVPGATHYGRVAPRGTRDLNPVIDDILAHGVDGFFYTGSPAGAARTAARLVAAGFKGPRAMDYTIAGPEFLKAAGPAAEGWQFFAPYTGPDAPEVAEVARAHQAAYGSAPDIWTAEAYDAARLVIARLVASAGGGGRPTRAELLTALTQGNFRGLTREYVFNEYQQVKGNLFFAHRVEGGRIRYAGPVDPAAG